MAVTNFKTENNTFRKLIGNGLTYRIPRFQRDYSWETEQWEDLSEPSIQTFHSMLVSPLDLANLATHLGCYSLCQTNSDGQYMILRFCDTRILPSMQIALSEKQKAHFFAPVTLWIYPVDILPLLKQGDSYRVPT